MAKRSRDAAKDRKPGRPRVEEKVDPEQLRALIFAGCTYAEIAGYFGISDASVERMAMREPLASVFRKGRADRKLSLRRAQTKLAMQGNVGMLVWLGKNELGQRDRWDPVDVDMNLKIARDSDAESAAILAALEEAEAPA